MQNVTHNSLLLSDDLERYFAENSDRDARKLWVFHHIPKTAGSSLANDLASHFKPRCNLYPGALIEDASELGAEDRHERTIQAFVGIQPERGYRFAHGHLKRSHLQLLQTALPNVAPFTMLRDPFNRIISSYRYQQTAVSPGSDEFIRTYPTFESYLEAESGSALNQRNACCKYLVGSRNASFDEARAILERDYVFCGLLEAYPLSFGVISTLMGKHASPKRHDNKTPELVANEITDPGKYRDEIYLKNQDDYRLFDYVRKNLKEKREKLWEIIRKNK
jgi:hypothetical protein